jgi:exodeoxyribonuclease V alpha subunit
MDSLYSFTGKIISEQSLKNGVYKYIINNDTKSERFVYFSNSSNTNGKGLDQTRFVTIKFYKKIDRFGQSNIIKEYNYGKLITDKILINNFLTKTIAIDKKLSEQIIDVFEANTLEMVFDRTSEVITMLNITDDIGKKLLDKIAAFKTDNKFAEFYVKLANLGIDKKYHKNISPTDFNIILENIYILFDKFKVPFLICDKIAINSLKYDFNCENRVNSFIKYLFKLFNSMGILYEVKEKIVDHSIKSKINNELVLDKLVKIDLKNKILYTIPDVIKKEIEIENICDQLIKINGIGNFITNDAHYEKNDTLDQYQKKAVKNAMENKISIVTGPPGTGKSHVIGNIVAELYDSTYIYIMAPTGAAVERLRREKYASKACISIITLKAFICAHSELFETNCIGDYDNLKEFGTKNYNDYSLFQKINFYEHFVFFIDEMSMVGMNDFYNFLIIVKTAITKSRIILVGDHNQLPSIKGGTILYDLIFSGKIKVVQLKIFHRTNLQEINNNAKRILMGEDIVPDGKYLKLYKVNQKEEIRNKLLKVIKKYDIKYENSCVLIPTRKNGICVDFFNPILQNYYNGGDEMLVYSHICFRPGDKLIHGKNRKDFDIYNGTIIYASKINFSGSSPSERNQYTVDSYLEARPNIIYRYKTKGFRSNDGLARMDIWDSKVDLAYCMTIHKAQGKGYDTVIIILFSTMYSELLTRNLFYTAITRTKLNCIIIADDDALIETKKCMKKRYTRLYNNNRLFLVDYANILTNAKTIESDNEISKFFAINNINGVNSKDFLLKIAVDDNLWSDIMLLIYSNL